MTVDQNGKELKVSDLVIDDIYGICRIISIYDKRTMLRRYRESERFSRDIGVFWVDPKERVTLLTEQEQTMYILKYS